MVDWLRRVLGTAPPSAEPEEEPAPEYEERPAPGIAALLEGVGEERTHAVLDLGGAAESSLRIYGRFAAHVRFVDLLSAAMSEEEGARGALRTVPVEPERPYDLVFAWDVLDRLFPEDRPRLMERLAQATAGHARLHLVTESSDAETTQPRRFTLVGPDRIRIEPTGPERPARRHLLPADVERLIAPFRVVHGFTLKGGLREYVAVRGG